MLKSADKALTFYLISRECEDQLQLRDTKAANSLSFFGRDTCLIT